MKKQKECIAMLLAGGQGSRLQPLTASLAKPAVPFGGKYRIIDFTLSNCVTSGIDTVGVLTQYQPLVLSEYIGNGQPWDLDRNFGGVHILPPFQAKKGGAWYRGTANAVWQNRQFIRQFSPDYVLVLSGDHIYRMDYREMLNSHIANGADATIAAIRVPEKEASRFGILSANETGRITDFEEKPAKPKGDLASMGIYIFNTEYLLRYLEADDNDPASANDFGKNVITAMLKDGGGLYAYRFSGYWRDVGTLESLWQANMDLIGAAPAFDLFGEETICSRSEALAPQEICEGAKVSDCIISDGCRIEGEVIGSVLSPGVVVGKGATVRNSVVMRGAVIEAGATVEYAVLDESVRVPDGAHIGEPGGKLTVIGREATV